ncbi:MAG: chemotaxis-specific protein-glutamate methyltransferase CheB [Candidatus Nitrotoga sp.]|nr:chemotaxis-specific protein-glutamate methyltransferase CheB [Candidatus Nitrotoga sp.]
MFGETHIVAAMTPVDLNTKSPIRVLLVDDSLITLAILKRILSSSPEIQVVGTAINGREALDLIPSLQPDVICTDLHMPVMDGLELTREVMDKFPRPILVLSISVRKDQTTNIFKLLEAGAIDVMIKPHGTDAGVDELDARELIGKIKILAGVVAIRKSRKEPPATPSGKRDVPLIEAAPPKIIGIGASTGGPQAFQEILSHLPGNFPLPLLCVQHVSEGFLQGMVDWLAGKTPLKIMIAATGVLPQPGTVYFPREGTHLTLDSEGRLECSSTLPYGGYRPSISVTFQSLAQHYGKSAAGVLLTGMGRDGVDGMQAITQAGGVTIAQDEESSIIFGMPKEAIAANAAHYVLPLPKIAPALLNLLNMAG